MARKSGREGLAAVFVGIAKTALPGLATLAVALVARNPARLEAPGKRFDANDFTMRY